MVIAVEVKRIVCLANSYKPGGRCVAGKELLPDGTIGGWVRPVLSTEEGGVGNERFYEDETDPEPKVLDIMAVPLIGHDPQDHQQENWLVARQHRWRRIGQLQVGELEHFIDPVQPLWPDSHRSVIGEIDRVPFSDAKSLTDSLRLIRISALDLTVYKNYSGRTSVRGQFAYAGRDHSLALTDPRFQIQYLSSRHLQQNIGSYSFPREFLLTVSLGGRYQDDNCYKIIAAIINPDGGGLS